MYILCEHEYHFYSQGIQNTLLGLGWVGEGGRLITIDVW